MQLLILLVGVLLGWGIEWLVDLFYWRRRQGGTADALAQAEAALVNARAENQQLQVQLEQMTAAREVAADDLTIIEGVGDKTAALLNRNGITTFAQLAATDVHRLRGILQDGGTGFQMHDPSSWPRQARLAASRDWVRLAALKAELVGGVAPPALDLEDDLTRIEGVGPKVAEILSEQGIRSYTQLAKAQPATLHTILQAAGPHYQLAEVAADTWPEQARLAADGKWQDLLDLQDQLKGGRQDTAPGAPLQ